VTRLTKKARTAMSSMPKTAPGIRFSDIDFRVFTLVAAMAGATMRGPGRWNLAEDGGETRHTPGSSGRVVLEQRSKVESSCPLKELRPGQFVCWLGR
jgi:hypothetical protein